MNIISFANTRPYDVYKWSTEYFLHNGCSKNKIQLIHPNARYNKRAKVIICWLIEALQKDIELINKEDAIIILMDNRETELERYGILIADTLRPNKCTDKASFTSIISSACCNLPKS